MEDKDGAGDEDQEDGHAAEDELDANQGGEQSGKECAELCEASLEHIGTHDPPSISVLNVGLDEDVGKRQADSLGEADRDGNGGRDPEAVQAAKAVSAMPWTITATR